MSKRIIAVAMACVCIGITGCSLNTDEENEMAGASSETIMDGDIPAYFSEEMVPVGFGVIGRSERLAMVDIPKNASITGNYIDANGAMNYTEAGTVEKLVSGDGGLVLADAVAECSNMVVSINVLSDISFTEIKDGYAGDDEIIVADIDGYYIVGTEEENDNSAFLITLYSDIGGGNTLTISGEVLTEDNQALWDNFYELAKKVAGLVVEEEP